MPPAPPVVPAPSGRSELVVPGLVADAGDDAATRFIEFFTANIRNANTRRAYGRAAGDFFAWMERREIGTLGAIQPVHVAAWVEDLGRRYAVPTVKQHLAAVRMLFDWLVTGQVVRHNPATAVRGPKHIVRKGKTPVLGPQETRMLLDRIPDESIAGRRDRALIGLMVYTFARISAALDMRIEDVFHQHRRLWVRLHEKGGKHHEMPCHHNLEHYLRDYIDAAGIVEDRKGPLFRTVERGTGRLSERPLPAQNAWDMVRRRARQAGIQTQINNHTFRATGITTYLRNGGELEKAAHMAAHSSTRTTQLYDRRSDEVSLDEVERIAI